MSMREQGILNPQPIDIHSIEYEKMLKRLAWHEMTMLKEFGFVCRIDHPHKTILFLLQMLRKKNITAKTLMQEAWNIACDSLRTTLCVQYHPEVVACGIVFFLSRK